MNGCGAAEISAITHASLPYSRTPHAASPRCGGRLVRPPLDTLMMIVQGDLRELLPAGRRIASRNAGLTELLRVQANRPGDGVHREIAERVGPKLIGHSGFDFRRQRTRGEKSGANQLPIVDMSIP